MVLVAEANAGKTMLAADLAVSSVLPDGELVGTFPRTDAESRRILIITQEDGRRNMRRRLEYLLRGRGVSPELGTYTDIIKEVLTAIRIETIDSIGTLLHLAHPVSFARVEGWIREHDAQVVIYDPLSTFRGGANENASWELEEAVLNPVSRLYARFGGLHVLTHHTGLEARPGGAAARGSSTLEAWADCRWAWVKEKVQMKHRSDNAMCPAVREPFTLSLESRLSDRSVRWLVTLGHQLPTLPKTAKKIYDTLVIRGSLSPSEQRDLVSNGKQRGTAIKVLLDKSLALKADDGTLHPKSRVGHLGP